MRRTFTNFKSLPALAAIILLVVTATANPQARKKLGEGRPGIQNIPAGWDPKAPCCRCKGGIEFPQAYTPQPGDKEALRGRAYILKDKARGKVIGRAVTDEGGNFEFPSPLGETADNYTNTARLVCNGDGNCWDFQPLPMDPGPVLEPILSEDPPLKGKRVGRATPKLVFKVFTCAPNTGGQPIKMYLLPARTPQDPPR